MEVVIIFKKNNKMFITQPSFIHQLPLNIYDLKVKPYKIGDIQMIDLSLSNDKWLRISDEFILNKLNVIVWKSIDNEKAYACLIGNILGSGETFYSILKKYKRNMYDKTFVKECLLELKKYKKNMSNNTFI